MIRTQTDIFLIVITALAALSLLSLFAALSAILRLRKELASSRKEGGELRRGLDDLRRDIEEGRRDIDGFYAVTEGLRSSVENQLSSMRRENSEQMERMRLTVDEKLQRTLDDRLSRSFESVRQSLDSVYRGLGEMQSLAEGVGDLKKVLSGVKTRGILGEIRLGAILSQILSREQYDENVATVPGSRERVEFAVKMPGSGRGFVYLPIDSKFPADRYEQLTAAYESGRKDDIIEARKALAAAVRSEAKDISGKYVEIPYTTDFAVMFLPFEGLYSEVVNLGLLEELQRSYRVMVAGPSTMAALLNSLQMGFRTLAIQKNASEVWRVLGGVKSEFDKFEGVLIAAQQKLGQANAELDKLVGARTRAIQKKLGQMQELEGGAASYEDDIDLSVSLMSQEGEEIPH